MSARRLPPAFLVLVATLGVTAPARDGTPEPAFATAERQGGPRAEAEVPDRYIVLYGRSTDDPAGETAARERSQGFRARHAYRRAVKGFSARLSRGQVERLEAVSITPDRRVRALAGLAPGEPTPAAGTRRIGAATTTSTRGASRARVAVLDTGIDLDHGDLDAANGTNCVTPGTAAEDGHGHGTHVAGTIGAENDGSGVVGVAPGTEVVAAKVLDDSGSAAQSSAGSTG